MTRCLAPAALATLLLAPPAGAEVHAVLVGVGDYLHLDADLAGPPHDLRLMAETLAARGVDPAAMLLLTTDPTGLPARATSAAPTRDGILAALDATAARAAPGDTVVFYFSGHGAQAPDASGDEGGGYDEIFLPMDASGWKGEIGMVENAILDDELQVWASGMLGRGVKLVGLIDACHSATGFRALDTGGVARALDPALLDIPEDAPHAPFTGATELSGDYVFLYSSQSDERSYEFPLGDSGVWHGEFTLKLSQVLMAAPQASWAQVLAATSDAMVRGPTLQVPEGEGPLLTAPVFGTGAAEARIRLEGGTLKAGLLQGIAEGAEVTLYAAGAGGAALGTAVVGKTDLRQAALTGPLPAGAAWAEVTAEAPVTPLVLALPVRADAADGQDYGAWLAALAPHAPPAGARPDLVPVLVDGGLAFAGPDGVLDPSSPRIRPEPHEDAAAALARSLATLTHGLRLREVLTGATGRGLTKAPLVTVGIERRPGAETPEGCSGTAGPGAPHDPARGVQGCDQLWLTLTNSSARAQDVTVLYLAADYTVQPIWPRANMVNRLAPGESARAGLQIDPAPLPGIEEIWIIAVPVDATKSQRVDLTALATPGGTRAMAGAADAVALWLESRLPGAERGTETEVETSRGFSLKPADLTLIRQIVRLQPASE